METGVVLTRADLKRRLPRPDLRTRSARAAQEYVANKGLKTTPFGFLEAGGATYYYYEVNSVNPGVIDVLELEVVRHNGEWERRATCYREDAP